MTGQHDTTPCSQCNRLAKPSSLVQTNPLSCRCKVSSVSAKWMQAPVLLSVEYLQVTGSRAQVLGAMQAASVRCVTWSLIQAGLWSSTFLYLTATICCGCKVPHSLAAEFACWGNSTSAFLPAMLWNVLRCQLAPGCFRCECQRVQSCAPNLI